MGGPELDKVETLLYDFTKLCPNIRDLSYADRLKAMKLTSIEQRFDRYRTLYVRKCIMNLVPNCGITVAREAGERNGLKVWIPNKKLISNLRSKSFIVRGSLLFKLSHYLMLDVMIVSPELLIVLKTNVTTT